MEEDGKLLGFVSHYGRADFWQRCLSHRRPSGAGIGKALMQYVQQRHPHLMLEVYQKNQPAINFYQAQVFTLSIAHGRMKPKLPTWIMSWPVVQTL
ncbi:GNAT family N-acetyltransferase [Enterobacter hormaechei]